jgi:RNA polymerase sigma-70 factor (ECF subfamily)
MRLSWGVMGVLSTTFYDAFRGRRAAADLEPLLAAVVARGHAAWPTLPVPPEALIRQLAGGLSERRLNRALAAIHAADLHLACACAMSSRAAIEALELHFMARVPRFVRRIDRGAAFAAEVQQTLRVKLLVASPGARPRIGEFVGSCSLATWLRLWAVRVALAFVGGRPEPAANGSHEIADKLMMDALDLEREIVEQQHQQVFQEALDAALATLTEQERDLLRRHFVDDVSLEQLAAGYGVHRATCARWLAAAREKLQEDTRRRVIASLQLSPAEFESLAGLMQSGLSVTLASR